MKKYIFILIIIIFNNNIFSLNYFKSNFGFNNFILQDSTELYAIFSSKNGKNDIIFDIVSNKYIKVKGLKVKMTKYRNSIAKCNDKIYFMSSKNKILEYTLDKKLKQLKLPPNWTLTESGFVKLNESIYFLVDSNKTKKLCKINSGKIIDCKIREIRSMKNDFFQAFENSLLFLIDYDSSKLILTRFDLTKNSVYVHYIDKFLEYEQLDYNDSTNILEHKFELNSEVFFLEKNYMVISIDYLNIKQLLIRNIYGNLTINQSTGLPIKIKKMQNYFLNNKNILLGEVDSFLHVYTFKKKKYEFYKSFILEEKIFKPIMFKNLIYYWDSSSREIRHISVW